MGGETRRRGRAGGGRPQFAQRDGGEAAYAAGHGDPLDHRRLCRSRGAGLGYGGLEPGRASQDARATGRVPAFHGRRGGEGLAGQRAPPARLRALGLPGAGARVRRAPNRAGGRHAGDRAVVPAGRVAAAARRSRGQRRARLSRFPVPPMRREIVRRTPALLVGGGPAGAVAALTLARAGAPHLLVERSSETGDALCGGFLSWRTLETLRAIGIARDALNRDDIRRLRLFAGRHWAAARLPRPALAVSRRRLDALLLDDAIAAGAAVERGVAVRTVDGGAARLADSGEAAGDALFLATGKHDLRGVARPAPVARDPALGLRVRLGPRERLDRLVGGTLELHLFDRGYAGLARQEDGP